MAANSTPSPSPSSALRDRYREDTERLRDQFAAHSSGVATTTERAAAVERLLSRLWGQQAILGESGYAMAALGGFGRGSLFPHSDVDLLFLCENETFRGRAKDPIRAVCQELWDTGLRVSPTTRTLEDCVRFDRDNVEFTISLLDSRLLTGDPRLFARLHDRDLPKLIAREAQTLVQGLTQVTRSRHGRFGNTIFHLEPNLKDGPGGLRDLNVTNWLTLISAVQSSSSWPESLEWHDDDQEREVALAAQFLSSARCFLHYRSRRDDNLVNWDAQEEMAARAIGTQGEPATSAEWMRLYFRHARTIHRACVQTLEHYPAGPSSLYRSFQRWRSRVSNEEFSVVEGRVFLQQAGAAREPDVVLRLFEFVARHGATLGLETERRIANARQALTHAMPQDGKAWRHLSEILIQPHAAAALRSMHALKLLGLMLPEMDAIDALVLRDLYHRYTVDEHTFLTIEILHRLHSTESEWLKVFAELASEIERPELLYLALLLHDTGKALAGSDHVHGSVQLARAAMQRLALSADDGDTVCFLIAAHLEMSSTMRKRDIHDPETIRELAGKLGTLERLKLLTLLTLADISAVNPEAMTPWKAQNLWQLYIATFNYFTRSVDEERFHKDVCGEQVERMAALLPEKRSQLLRFLEGLPQRYVISHTPEQVIQHFEMANRLPEDPVQVGLRQHNQQHELIIVTGDHPGLFATITGILYGWGMDITKASAFSNQAGVIVDVFYFKDRFRTLELNPPERERFKKSVIQILLGEASLEPLVQSRTRSDQKQAKLKVETRLRFDDESSPSSTLLEVTTQDRPGLLHSISSILSAEDCSIEVALIDTEGAVAHDVFYLSSGGMKLTRNRQREVEWALMTELGDSLPTRW
jgi:[protein-PII] uridylyltransferase